MKVDVSIVSFIIVLIIAVPVTALRSQTYAVGYEIANLKARERDLRERNLSLKAELARSQSELISRATSQRDLVLPEFVDISEIPEQSAP